MPIINTIRKPYSKKGDKIEVKMSDIDYNVYYKKKVAIDDEKALAILLNDLKNLGVKFELLNEQQKWW